MKSISLAQLNSAESDVSGSPIDLQLFLPMACRHGLIAGSTGSGKTVTLKVLAEGFSRAGVPVFIADVKGDIASLAFAGKSNPKFDSFLQSRKVAAPEFRAFPTAFWDLQGKLGHTVRCTVSEMGPLLLSRLLKLNETQSGILSILFRVADEQGLLLLDLKDLRAVLQHVGERAKELQLEYGNISSASIGAIQRALLQLEEEGAAEFFGEPVLALADLQRLDSSGLGVINILAAEKLIHNSRAYSTFLLWLLAELFEELPEVGDLEKPKLVFIFDEAHLLFADSSPALLEKIEQVVRLIRSKGVGVYFVTQDPLDIPDSVRAQLGNRVQHALRAFSAKDKKALKAIAETFRENKSLDVESAIGELEIGEALISFLDEQGAPQVVERAYIKPPASRFGTISDTERNALQASSPLAARYAQSIDRESAFEILKQRREAAEAPPAPATSEVKTDKKEQSSVFGKEMQAFFVSMARSMGNQAARAITRGLFGSARRR